MSTAIMSPITTPISVPQPVSELSRSAATYYARSSSSLPQSTLPLWSLGNSRTTISVAAAARHRRSSSSAALIEGDPDRDEEDHIRGIKRKNRNAVSSTSESNTTTTTILLSPASTSPSKRRCYPTMMHPFLQNEDSVVDQARGIPRSLMDNSEADLLPPELSSTMTDQNLSHSPSFSSSLEPPSHCAIDPTPKGSDRSRFERECGSPDREGSAMLRSCHDAKYESDDDDTILQHSATSPAPPNPPQFRRHSTIRDRLDLACSIDEFTRGAMPSS